MPISFRLAATLFFSCALFAPGCMNHPYLAQPGTIEQQRLRATIHDPYSDNDLGPYVDGGRPREFLDPLPEPVRSRIYADSWWWRTR